MGSLTERLGRRCDGAVHDVLRSHGMGRFVLPPSQVAATETELGRVLIGGMEPAATRRRYGKY
jgi:hypothetical protein